MSQMFLPMCDHTYFTCKVTTILENTLQDCLQLFVIFLKKSSKYLSSHKFKDHTNDSPTSQLHTPAKLVCQWCS